MMRPLVFRCGGDRLAGTLHLPPADAPPSRADDARTGILFLVGGPQVRAGAARGLLHLAEGLCATGHAVLRFDWRGEGDSEGARRPFDARDEEIRAALAAFRRACPQIARIFLLGLCDGASAALLHAGGHANNRPDEETDETRPAGLILINPWMRDDDLRPPLGNGRGWPIAVSARLAGLRAASPSRLETRLHEAARCTRLPVLWLAARSDPTGRDALIRLHAPAWRRLMRRRTPDGDRWHRVLSWPGDDHVLARPETRLRLIVHVSRWIERTKTVRHLRHPRRATAHEAAE